MIIKRRRITTNENVPWQPIAVRCVRRRTGKVRYPRPARVEEIYPRGWWDLGEVSAPVRSSERRPVAIRR